MAVGGDADRAAVGEQRHDHAGGGVGLARAGRALDGQAGAVEGADEADRRVDARLVGAAQRLAGGGAGDPGRTAAEQLATGGERAGAVDAVGQQRFAEADQGGALGGGVDRARRDEGLGVRGGRGLAAAQLEGAGGGVEGHEHARAARRLAAADPDGLGLGVARGGAHLELVLLGGVELVGPDVGALVDHRLPHRGEAGDGLGVVAQVVEVAVQHAVEEPPPVGLVLPLVPAQQVGHEPAGAGVVAVGLGGGLGAAVEQRLDERLGGVVVRRLVGGGRVGRDRLRGADGPGHRLALVEELLAVALQPVAQPPRRLHVVAVVGLDGVEDLLVAGLQPALVLHDAGAGVGDLGRAGRHVERLELLERVRRRADHQALAHHPVEVDEHLAPQQVVELLLPGAVAAHQLAEGGRLVGGVVVHVQAGVATAALHDEVDELLEGLPLLPRGVAPEGLEREAAVVEPADAVEVLEALAVAGERVALDVVEEVARIGGGQGGQAPVLLRPGGRARRAAARRRPAGAGGGPAAGDG